MKLLSNDYSEIAKRNVASRSKERLIAWIADLLRENSAFEAKLGRDVAVVGMRGADEWLALERAWRSSEHRAVNAERRVEHLQARIREMGLDR